MKKFILQVEIPVENRKEALAVLTTMKEDAVLYVLNKMNESNASDCTIPYNSSKVISYSILNFLSLKELE